VSVSYFPRLVLKLSEYGFNAKQVTNLGEAGNRYVIYRLTEAESPPLAILLEHEFGTRGTIMTLDQIVISLESDDAEYLIKTLKAYLLITSQ
jgi:hypothetical protein